MIVSALHPFRDGPPAPQKAHAPTFKDMRFAELVANPVSPPSRRGGLTGGIAGFQSQMSGDLDHDRGLLRAALRNTSTAGEAKQVLEGFLNPPETSAAAELSDMLHILRTSFHPLHGELDRMQAAGAEFKTALRGFTDADDIRAGAQMLSAIEAAIAVVKQRIETDIENRFLNEVGGTILMGRATPI